jgi:uncharacterized membrane protein YedE/YeeE
MFQELGLDDWTPKAAALGFGLLLGVIWGALGEQSKFCLRRGIAGEATERSAALGVWLMALLTALLGTAVLRSLDLMSFDGHRFMVTELPLLTLIPGGLAFGFGMVLTRGCVSRLCVLTGTGNLRALLVLVVFAIVAHATLKGVLAPMRTSLGSFTFTTPMGDLAQVLGTWPVTILLAIVLGFVIFRLQPSGRDIALSSIMGLLVPIGWLGTGFVLYDDFDPIALETLSFTAPTADTLFWVIASTSIDPGFGVGLILGAVCGGALSSIATGRFHLVSFEGPRQTGRYMAGAVLMGVGGVLAGGCTVGAGLSGVSALSLSATVALASIIAGGLVARSTVST